MLEGALTALIEFAERHPRLWSALERWAGFLWRHKPDLTALNVALSVFYAWLTGAAALSGSWGYMAFFASAGVVSAVAMWRLQVAARELARSYAEFRNGAP
jgi:hypothetical protein